MTAPFVREVELAYRLGFTEMEDFRRAMGRGEIPPPSMSLGTGRKKRLLWSPEEVDKWTERMDRGAEDQAVQSAIDSL